ncbi:MAG: hypothetical protein FJW36_16475 [Acidobacteria bacterium]|nr:hypothetical protein [Acidobacteriota bacterium]
MSFSILLIGLSVALFAYWFRYSCLLILRTQTPEDFSGAVSRENGLSFDLVKRQIEATGDANLAELYASLEREYAVVNSLLDQISPSSQSENLLEIKLLRANFRVTQLWFRLSHTFGLRSSISALSEMADTIGHFANTCGQQTCSGAAV